MAFYERLCYLCNCQDAITRGKEHFHFGSVNKVHVNINAALIMNICTKWKNSPGSRSAVWFALRVLGFKSIMDVSNRISFNRYNIITESYASMPFSRNGVYRPSSELHSLIFIKQKINHRFRGLNLDPIDFLVRGLDLPPKGLADGLWKGLSVDFVVMSIVYFLPWCFSFSAFALCWLWSVCSFPSWYHALVLGGLLHLQPCLFLL